MNDDQNGSSVWLSLKKTSKAALSFFWLRFRAPFSATLISCTRDARSLYAIETDSRSMKSPRERDFACNFEMPEAARSNWTLIHIETHTHTHTHTHTPLDSVIRAIVRNLAMYHLAILAIDAFHSCDN